MQVINDNLKKTNEQKQNKKEHMQMTKDQCKNNLNFWRWCNDVIPFSMKSDFSTVNSLEFLIANFN
ncbi:hypothetical protein FACS189472_18580 [Alphaproteobacteria bacterium]|nr:hypothetical protein FACS189472_18580 [Alphaproteobacteria bacterium]